MINIEQVVWLGLILGAGLIDRPSEYSSASQYEQKRGPALLSIEGDNLQDGRIEIRLGDKLRVMLIVEGPADLVVEKPSLITESKNWQVRETSEPKVERVDGRTRWSLSALLEAQAKDGLPLQGKPLDLPLKIAPLRYSLEAGKGNLQEAKWDEVTVRVTTTVAKVDPSEARPITGIEELPVSKSPWIGILRWSGIALLGLFLVLFVLELKRRLTPPRPALAPHEWAARELARLESLGLPQHGQAERYHTLVSDTIRRYLELRFRLRAPRQTTAEFLDAMRQSPQLTPDQRSLLRDFLERCDLAKFARAEFSLQECQNTASMACSFVEQTKPIPEPLVAAKVKPA